MAFFNKFFRKRMTGERTATQKKADAGESSVQEKSDRSSAPIRFGVGPTVVRPHRTEKSSAGEQSGVYTFVVRAGATKLEVKRAVEKKYGVAVRAVRVVSVPGKVRRRGRQIGWKTGFKKAFVTLEKGAAIDLG